MAERVSGLVELWDGWRVTVPNDCMAERNADGSWSAWDAAHTIDVHIIATAGRADGSPLSAEEMLGRAAEIAGADWIGFVEERVEDDEQGPAHRLAIAAAAENTLASCWVAYRDPTERAWGEKVLEGLVFTPAPSKRRLFGRR